MTGGEEFQAHPFLDPQLLEFDPLLRQVLETNYEASAGEDGYSRVLDAMFSPSGTSRPLPENVEIGRRYFVDANAYLQELMSLITPAARKPLALDPEVAALNDYRSLLGLLLRGDTPRIRYEAQRKLYLGKLLFDIDHEWSIQRAPRHLEAFEAIMDRELWAKANRMKTVDVYYNIADDGVHMEVNTQPSDPAQERWQFYLTRVRRGKRPIHVYHYACRFKREVAPQFYREGEDTYEVRERKIWETLHQRRGGSILSKMIRKGETHPSMIRDLLGAMFIVTDKAEALAFQELLFEILGGPLSWRHRVDTMSQGSQRHLLNPHSGEGYEVIKGDVDILMEDAEGGFPYMFTAEIQIYTVEGYLRTVHSTHYASHHKLKLRQFVEGLMPFLYPRSIYGDVSVSVLTESPP